jgi:hypothetical protein
MVEIEIFGRRELLTASRSRPYRLIDGSLCSRYVDGSAAGETESMEGIAMPGDFFQQNGEDRRAFNIVGIFNPIPDR